MKIGNRDIVQWVYLYLILSTIFGPFGSLSLWGRAKSKPSTLFCHPQTKIRLIRKKVEEEKEEEEH